MAKRKTFCGNARKCSMLLTNVTRSASYEALPNHRLFPAKSGLTSRFPLWNRGLWHRRSNKSGDAVGRPSRRSSLLGDPGAKFLVETGAPNQTMKNSLNYVSTCLRVVDTRRAFSSDFSSFPPIEALKGGVSRTRISDFNLVFAQTIRQSPSRVNIPTYLRF